jgi:hypothetical protein
MPRNPRPASLRMMEFNGFTCLSFLLKLDAFSLTITMGLFDFLKSKPASRDSRLPQANPEDLAQVSYEIAYFGLPNWVHKEFDQFLKNWRNPTAPFGIMLCEYGCTRIKVRPSPEQAAAFKIEEGQLSSSCGYFLFQFPKPRAYPLDLKQLKSVHTKGGKPPVLAPFFAAVLDDYISGQRSYYILGQSLMSESETTLRSVTADGRNYNLGLGPEPTSFAFLERLKQQ